MNNNNGATLMAHCGTKKLERHELLNLETPESTRTHKPIPHHKVAETLIDALSFRHLNVVRDEYAVSNDGMKMFGVMDLDAAFSDFRFSIGLRNSNDKSMSLAMTAGYRVTVCDNMMFNGDFNPLSHKHTRNFELIDSITIAVDRIQRNFQPLENKIVGMKDIGLSDKEARLIVYHAFLDKKVKGIPKSIMEFVHKHYFKPEFKEFEGRNLWSLSNAFTSSFKKLGAIRQFEITAKFGTFLSKIQDELNASRNLDLNLNGNHRKSIYDETSEKNVGIKGTPLPNDDYEESFDEVFDEEEIDGIVNRFEEKEEKKAAVQTA